jgi:GNAT superfamily N-acetyltransferase
LRSHRIVNLRDCPEHLESVARWCAVAFAGSEKAADRVAAALREHLEERPYPFTLVLLYADRPVGCVHGVESELDERPDLEPFIAALFVVEERRGEGLGSLLLNAAERQARAAGFATAYLCAWSRPEWYIARGWTIVEPEAGEKRVPLMVKSV